MGQSGQPGCCTGKLGVNLPASTIIHPMGAVHPLQGHGQCTSHLGIGLVGSSGESAFNGLV